MKGGTVGAVRGTPDYTAMRDFDIIEACGDDGAAWAAAFCQTCEKLGIQGIDEGWMTGWFANAIEASWDKRTHRAQPPTKPVYESGLGGGTGI